MNRLRLFLFFAGAAALLGLAACAPYWGPTPFGGGGMMGGGGGMMGGGGGPGGQQGSPYGGGGGMMGGGMMGGGNTGRSYSGVSTPLSHDDAEEIAGRYLASLNNPDLAIHELEEYYNNFYMSVIEKSTGRGAIEIIIDKYSGSYQPEMQTMMWNGKYGMMGGMMGGYQQAQMSVTEQQAMKIAQDYLDVAYPGTEADEIVAYYGYYTIMTELEGGHYGMLSINGYSGNVWYHSWHGMFISEMEEGD